MSASKWPEESLIGIGKKILEKQENNKYGNKVIQTLFEIHESFLNEYYQKVTIPGIRCT